MLPSMAMRQSRPMAARQARVGGSFEGGGRTHEIDGEIDALIIHHAHHVLAPRAPLVDRAVGEADGLRRVVIALRDAGHGEHGQVVAIVGEAGRGAGAVIDGGRLERGSAVYQLRCPAFAQARQLSILAASSGDTAFIWT